MKMNVTAFLALLVLLLSVQSADCDCAGCTASQVTLYSVSYTSISAELGSNSEDCATLVISCTSSAGYPVYLWFSKSGQAVSGESESGYNLTKTLTCGSSTNWVGSTSTTIDGAHCRLNL